MARNKFEKGNQIGNRFSTNNQPEKRRKPKLFSILKKKYGIDLGGDEDFTPGQMQDLLQSLLRVDVRQTTALNVMLNEDLKRIVKQVREGNEVALPKKGEALNQAFVVLAQAISTEASKGESSTIRWIIEYLFGKATQPIEGDINTQVTSTVDLSVLSTEELVQYNALLEKISNAGSKDNGTE